MPYTEQKEINDFFLRDQVIPWSQLCQKFPGLTIKKLFSSVTPQQVNGWISRARESNPSYKPPDFFSYYSVSWKNNIPVKSLVRTLKSYKQVEHVYYQHGPLQSPAIAQRKNRTFDQNHFKPAPEGIDIAYASKFSGADGNGNVRLIDIEQGWIVDHEDIDVDTLECTGINCKAHQDHGAAVLGIIKMKGQFGVGKGIVPAGKASVISQWRPDGTPNTADAIMAAIAHLNFGDVLLLEVQTSLTYLPEKLWPVEVEDAVYEAIRLATALGIIVIEPAANGGISSPVGNDLDQLSVWRRRILRVADKGFRDSGAIIVAAVDSSTSHKRLHSSNYGTRINCYALGQGVVSTGYYPLSSNGAIDRYTRNFGGTSSAAAIIAGVVLSIQGIAENNFSTRIGAAEVRHLLSDPKNSTPSCNGLEIDKIGGMPDLKKILQHRFNL
jgi:hypothetical protein